MMYGSASYNKMRTLLLSLNAYDVKGLINAIRQHRR